MSSGIDIQSEFYTPPTILNGLLIMLIEQAIQYHWVVHLIANTTWWYYGCVQYVSVIFMAL